MTCPTGKQQYATAAAAARVMDGMKRTHHRLKGASWHRGPLTVYRCKQCDGWHVGNGVAPLKNARPRYEPVCDWSMA